MGGLGMSRFARVAGFLTAALALLGGTTAVAGDGLRPSSVAIPNLAPAADRFGVGVHTGFGQITDYDVSRIHIGWYSDWGFRPDPPHPYGTDYAQVIYVREGRYPPDWTALAGAIAANPGSLWIVGNEPEALLQGARTPSQYAVIYHDVYRFIKSRDAAAQVAIGGVVEPSPLRFRWLEEVLAWYQARFGARMPVDVWNTHVQILRERGRSLGCDGCFGAYVPVGLTDADEGLFSSGVYADDPYLAIRKNADPGEFAQMIRDFRAWMKAHGQQDKALIISEYGVLYPSDYLVESGDWAEGDLRVLDFMTATFDFLLTAVDPSLGYPTDGNRLVQRWLWYSLNARLPSLEDPQYDDFNGSLFDWQHPTDLTLFGTHFSRYTSPLAATFVDLVPQQLAASPGVLPADGHPFVITATLSIRNLGTQPASGVVVRFYEGGLPPQGHLAAQTMAATVPSRHAAGATLSATWLSGPPAPGETRRIGVVVDPDSAVVETDCSNNTAVLSIPTRRRYQLFLPSLPAKSW